MGSRLASARPRPHGNRRTSQCSVPPNPTWNARAHPSLGRKRTRRRPRHSWKRPLPAALLLANMFYFTCVQAVDLPKKDQPVLQEVDGVVLYWTVAATKGTGFELEPATGNTETNVQVQGKFTWLKQEHVEEFDKYPGNADFSFLIFMRQQGYL